MLTISSQLKILSQDNHKNGTTLLFLLSCYDNMLWCYAFCYHALITLPSSVNSYSKRLFIALPQVFIAVNGEVCLHNAMIQGEMFLLIRSVVDAVFLVHCWTPQLNVCFYSAAPAWQASKGVEERKERKKSGKCQFPGGSTYVGLYGEVPSERGIFFRLQVYERVGKSVIWVCESTPKG